MWGFWEGRHWRPEAALYRRDWSEKPNGRAWREMVFERWWTQAEGLTGNDGLYKVRGLLGEYEIEAVAGGKTVKASVTLKRGSGVVELRLE